MLTKAEIKKAIKNINLLLAKEDHDQYLIFYKQVIEDVLRGTSQFLQDKDEII